MDTKDSEVKRRNAEINRETAKEVREMSTKLLEMHRQNIGKNQVSKTHADSSEEVAAVEHRAFVPL